MDEKVFVSTDIGSDIDDALSLLVMFNTGINLKGVYTVNGDLQSRSFIAKHMVDLSGKEITVGVGESKPLGSRVAPYSFIEDCLIDDKFIDEEKEFYTDVPYKSFEEVGIVKEGVENLSNKLLEEKDNIIFSIAPLTNIALLVKNYPESTKNIKQLYVMGARFSNGSEHNIFHDVEAANIVFQSNIPITVVPGDLCERYKLQIDFINNLKSPVGKYVEQMAKSFMAFITSKDYIYARYLDIMDLSSCLKTFVIPLANKIPDKSMIAKLFIEKEKLIRNLDDTSRAIFEPDYYLKKHKDLIKFLKENESTFDHAKGVANTLEELIPKKLSIADVYVPYCYMHPERLRIETGNLSFDTEGKTNCIKDSKHKIVKDLDFEHFKEFLKKHLK